MELWRLDDVVRKRGGWQPAAGDRELGQAVTGNAANDLGDVRPINTAVEQHKARHDTVFITVCVGRRTRSERAFDVLCQRVHWRIGNHAKLHCISQPHRYSLGKPKGQGQLPHTVHIAPRTG